MASARRRNGRRADAASAAAPPLPAELLARVMRLLTWHETSAMARVCSRWRAEVRAAASAQFEWRCTSLLAADAASEAGPAAMRDAEARLASGHGAWADTEFPPQLVLLAARTTDPRPFVRGAYWTRLVAAMERARLLPPRCVVLGTLSMTGKSSRRGDDGDGDGDALQVTAAHLPGTELATATFERKELRQSARCGGVDAAFPACSSSDGGAGFLVFSANRQSAEELVAAVGGWGAAAGGAIAGAVLPHADCSSPLMLYQRDALRPKPTAKTTKKKEGETRRNGHTRQVVRLGRHRGRPASPSTTAMDAPLARVQFPSNLVLRLAGGRLRLRAWTAGGFAPVTPVVRCCGSPFADAMAQAVVYHQVEVHRSLPEPLSHASQPNNGALGADVGLVCSLRELVRARMDLSSDQTLKIVSSRDPDALERCFPPSPAVPTSSSDDLETIDCIYSAADDAIFSLGERRWERDAFGVVMGRGGGDWRRQEAQRAIELARRECESRGELPFGSLAASSVSLSVSSSMKSGSPLQLAAMATELAIGPDVRSSRPSVQLHAASGVLLCVAPAEKSCSN